MARSIDRTYIHCIQAKDGKFIRNNLHEIPASIFKLMPLKLRNKMFPDIIVCCSPLIWSRQENIMRQDVIITNSRNNRNLKIVARVRVICILWLSKHLIKFRNQQLILAYQLFLGADYTLVVIVSCRIARPYDKINFVLNILLYPGERCIDERYRAVAARHFRAEITRLSGISVASATLLSRRANYVKWIRVEI